MDRYQRVEKPREDTQINENEIRITIQGRMRSYITYATTLLQEKGSNEIVFKAMGRAINKTVMIVELVKRRIADLHQNTAIGSTDITDTWEPLEEGLLPLETTRHVSLITITLSKKEIDTASVGYQPPLPKDQVKPLVDFDYEGEGSSGGRGRGRGGRGRGRARGSTPVHSKTTFLGHRITQMGAVAEQEENRPRSFLQMTKPVDSIDVVVISSDSDDNYQDSDGNLSDHERDDKEAETNLKGNDEGKKVAGADVSHSSVQVKTEDDKKADDDRKVDDDCYILDFDPFESATTDLANKLSLSNGNGNDQEEDDLSVLAEKGEVACRDFPHSRHQCAEFLFDNTPHESFCSQCYCYVCDTPAPCTQWKGYLHSHCHASDRLSMWKDLRSSRRNTEVIKSNSEIGLW